MQTKAGVPRGNRFFRTARRESKDSFELSCVIEQPELLAQDIREFFRPLRNAAERRELAIKDSDMGSLPTKFVAF
jgi:hypothetical protein